MSYWNYRIIKHKSHRAIWYKIHEVFYNEDNSICCYDDGANVPNGGTVDGLKRNYGMMSEAFDFPILVEGEFKCTGFSGINLNNCIPFDLDGL